MPAIERRWTAADVRELMRDDRPWPRYELIDGELLVTPGPSDAHQDTCVEFCLLLDGHLRRVPVGVAKVSPSDVPIKPENVVQPDVYVIPVYDTADGEAIDWPSGTFLLLAIEVLSPSSLHTDRVTKRDLYLDNGVCEYWIVDLDAQLVEQWEPGRPTPKLFRDEITWTPTPGMTLRIDLPALFERVRVKSRATEGWRKRK